MLCYGMEKIERRTEGELVGNKESEGDDPEKTLFGRGFGISNPRTFNGMPVWGCFITQSSNSPSIVTWCQGLSTIYIIPWRY